LLLTHTGERFSKRLRGGSRLQNHILERLQRIVLTLPPNLVISVNLEKCVARAGEAEGDSY
jgi:hypothetical protein